MSQIQAKIIEHSVAPNCPDLITFQLTYPRFIHSELMTHRVFSRNASSSRAIPVAKMIEQVRTNPAMPVHWGQNQAGMQAKSELQGEDRLRAVARWQLAAEAAANHAEVMMELGLHKQVANRILEPFQLIHVIVTATEWDNFYELRHHEDADPNIYTLADAMLRAERSSEPTARDTDRFNAANWHLPYVSSEERMAHLKDPLYLAKLSAARCARVSYLTHDGKRPDPQKDLELYDRLVGSRPLHASPIEHQAYPDRHPVGSKDWFSSQLHGNFVGWCQYRKAVEQKAL